ncbi:MAG: YIP1 family protein [Terriglobales bacterium]
MSTTAAPPAAPEPPPLSAVGRIVNTFVAPTKTFLDLKRKTTWTSWVAPWLLIVAVSVGYALVVGNKVGFERVVQNNMNAAPKQAEKIEKLPPDQRAQQLTISLAFTKAITYGFSLLVLVGAVMVAALLMASFNFGAGAEVSFKSSLAIVMYSSLTGAVSDVLAMASVLAGADPEGFFIQNPIATNPAYLMNPADSPALYAFVASLDVISIWKWVLYAIGFSCVSKMNKGTTLAVAFAWFLLITLIQVGFAAAFN